VDKLELAISSLMIQLRLPVVAVVEDLVASGSLCTYGDLIGLIELKGRTTDDGVNMGRDLAGKDNRIASLDGERSTVDCKLGGGRANKCKGEQNLGSHNELN
jgi:hypothetical protein